MQLLEGVAGRSLRFLVGDRVGEVSVTAGWARFELPAITDHEVIVIE